MTLVFGLAAMLWGLGAALRLPRSLRLSLLGLLWLAVIALHFTLPDGHPLRLATGTDARFWLLLGIFGIVALGYRFGLRALRAKAAPKAAPAPTDPKAPFREVELDRYARHIMLREIGGPGQRKLKNARVLVIGAGGLGSPALLYLAAAGVGTIGVVDDDTVDGSNLQRQIIHADQRIGMPKVFSAEIAMRALNPFIEVRPYNRRLTEPDAESLFADYDLILDGTDNFDTRYMANRVAVKLGKPLISGALTQWEGQLSLFDPAQNSPCYECVFPTRPAPGMVPSCAEAGVAAPLPGVIGAMMATEAIKHLTGAGETLRGRLMIHDALYAETRVIAVHRRADCPVCGKA
ncbi:HesA/MoeB/ThiF family protein [Paragemmobacter straminiformis]|uniref:Molybdopterin-synthase adenylyltransferase n=1 Tax=Paragemmobacter straminiformis TaxID=2045119 RepID=A0A842IBK8_9RHOB|nr:HesA/MoeB/ThiF family protein [Gemmobacter straminiformis]MBC2836378.1 HesA/MoeB/ThiF family protein [Gemmobacter straminiformis]